LFYSALGLLARGHCSSSGGDDSGGKKRGVTLQGLKTSINLVILEMNIMINLESDA
jgi:hypothetical protein